jgi:hypothetical protein
MIGTMRKASWILLSAAVFWANVSEARVEQSLGYTKQQSYNTALRFLRVDRGYKLIEKDVDSGYLLFEYPVQGSEDVTNGSIEIIQRKDEVTVVVQLPQMPRYHEKMVMSSLLKKLQEDYGAPPAARKDPPKEEKPSEEEKPEKDDEPIRPGEPKPRK